MLCVCICVCACVCVCVCVCVFKLLRIITTDFAINPLIYVFRPSGMFFVYKKKPFLHQYLKSDVPAFTFASVPLEIPQRESHTTYTKLMEQKTMGELRSVVGHIVYGSGSNPSTNLKVFHAFLIVLGIVLGYLPVSQ